MTAKIADVMKTEVATCRATDSLNRAAQLMWEWRCGCVPVLDEGDHVIGMLTDRDICMASYTQGRRLDDIPVAVAMSRPVHTCAPNDPVDEVEDIMMAHGVRRLVVVEDGRVRGLVSIDDIAMMAAVWDGKAEIDLERVALALAEIARRETTADDEDPREQHPGGQLSEALQDSLEALKTLRDEIRVDLNLAGKEARERWRRLETRLRVAELRARGAKRTGARTLAALVESARHFRTGVRDRATAGSSTRSRARS